MSRLRLGLLVLVLALPAAAAQDLVIYRCVAPDGQVLLQNTARCPKGMRQERRVVERPATPPVPARAAPALPRPATGTVVAVPASRPGAADAAGAAATAIPGTAPAIPATTSTGMGAVPTVDATAPTRPVPALMACRTREGESYFSDEAVPSRCVPMRTVGLDGRTATAAEACERVFDDCQPVADTARCTAWADYRRQAEGVATFQPDNAATAREVLARIDTALAGTPCAR
ncbi:DUF4124 domain-containing protein [Lysobacter humi (ex Lee et al. 2017)]